MEYEKKKVVLNICVICLLNWISISHIWARPSVSEHSSLLPMHWSADTVPVPSVPIKTPFSSSGHVVQFVCHFSLEKVPIGHGSQAFLLTFRNVPAEQFAIKMKDKKKYCLRVKFKYIMFCKRDCLLSVRTYFAVINSRGSNVFSDIFLGT